MTLPPPAVTSSSPDDAPRQRPRPRPLAETTAAGTTPAVVAAGLTEREADVLELLAAGLTNREIANELYLNAETVKSHVGRILTKLEVRNRTQAAIVALGHPLADLPGRR